MIWQMADETISVWQDKTDGVEMGPSQQCVPQSHTDAARTPGTQRAKIAEKVHKPLLGVNVINFEFNGSHAFILVPWSPSDTKKL